MKILYYKNFDMDSIVTPVKVDVLETLLKSEGYDVKETKFLVDGFQNGFSLGYMGSTAVTMRSPNLPLGSIEKHIILWNKIMKEVKEKCYAGPFAQIPFSTYIQSPIGLVLKDNGTDWRLIFHQSYPCGKGTSVNANTPEHMCKVQYPDFNEAIQLCIQTGKSCNISRLDMKVAFRNLGISRKYWRYLIMKARSPLDGKTYFFLDKCLAFGASISCSHFQRFSNSIAYLMTK